MTVEQGMKTRLTCDLFFKDNHLVPYPTPSFAHCQRQIISARMLMTHEVTGP